MGAFRMLAGMADVFAEVTVGTAENGGKTIHMKLNGNSTEIVNTGLMMLMQFAGDRFLRMNSDEYKSQTGKIGDYVSIARGVLATTQSVSVQNAEITLKVNYKGELESAEGSASVKLNTTKDGEHTLDGKFSLEISDRGTTKAEHFDPDKHVAPAKQ